MSSYRERTYRQRVKSIDLISFHVAVKETDLWVSAAINLEKETRDLILDCRQQLETYIKMHPRFVSSLTPYPFDPLAPPIVKKMIDATNRLGIGPMASVAGLIAQHVAEGLLAFSDQVIVENGGDIFLKTNRAATVSIFAGTSALSERFGLKIPLEQMPMGVCTSSATVGHSLSTGGADACCILSHSAALADGAATAIGNKVKNKGDMKSIDQWVAQIEGIIGGVVIVGDSVAAWGEIELIDL
ncbi:conserved hypothetical protein [uncultured Desulfobacterium sp.]|uniref:ApbE family lipoprotein n=1 Tax=uncultured Desulfobacterium sp. TaxID=201089 RepID=A0A445MVM0_9BACT|nr:conserved hypothetical protein [uncultured Desulfobacterium sp.]